MNEFKISFVANDETGEIKELCLIGNTPELTTGIIVLINHAYEGLEIEDREFLIDKINKFTSDIEKARKEILKINVGGK